MFELWHRLLTLSSVKCVTISPFRNCEFRVDGARYVFSFCKQVFRLPICSGNDINAILRIKYVLVMQCCGVVYREISHESVCTRAFRRVCIHTEKNQVTSEIVTVYHEKALHNKFIPCHSDSSWERKWTAKPLQRRKSLFSNKCK